MPQKIEISHRTIVFTAFFLLALWGIFQIRQIILALFVSIILMSALNPTVDRLERLRVSRSLAILLIYIIGFGFFSLVVAGVVPPLVDQTRILVSRLPNYLEQFGIFGINEELIVSQLAVLPENLVRLTVNIFSNVIAVFTVIVVTFYLLLERKNLDSYLLVLFGEGGEKKAEALVDKIEHKLGGWVRGQLTLMVIVGALSYTGLRLLGIDFALPLALLAGILEIIPNIGPVVSSVPAVLAGLAISPLLGLAVAALYFLIQQLENSIIVPKVMERVAGVNPLVTIVSLLIGFKLAGVVGAVLAVPVVLVIQVVAAEVFASERFQKL